MFDVVLVCEKVLSIRACMHGKLTAHSEAPIDEQFFAAMEHLLAVDGDFAATGAGIGGDSDEDSAVK